MIWQTIAEQTVSALQSTAQMYREKSDSRQYSICTICRRTDHRRGSSEGFMQGVKSVTKQAFMKSIPIMCSYIFVSMAYGMMDGECRICVVLFASYKPYRVYRSFSVCPDHIFKQRGIDRYDCSDGIVDEQQTDVSTAFHFWRHSVRWEERNFI